MRASPLRRCAHDDAHGPHPGHERRLGTPTWSSGPHSLPVRGAPAVDRTIDANRAGVEVPRTDRGKADAPGDSHWDIAADLAAVAQLSILIPAPAVDFASEGETAGVKTKARTHCSELVPTGNAARDQPIFGETLLF